jgi:hypothetical protein
MSEPATIPELHATFVRLTRQDISLNMLREQQWWQWIAFRKERRFTVADLVAVVSYLQKEIRKGDRNPGALKFTNLIGSPDRFEEDLAMANAQLRVPPVGTLSTASVIKTKSPDGSVTERRMPSAGTADTSRTASEVLASPAFQEFCKLKEKL